MSSFRPQSATHRRRRLSQAGSQIPARQRPVCTTFGPSGPPRFHPHAAGRLQAALLCSTLGCNWGDDLQAADRNLTEAHIAGFPSIA